MTPEQRDQLQALNTSVNVIPYVAGQGPTEPVDYWSYKPEPGKSWVCRDYTEDKAEQLRQAGWSPLALLVMLCWTEVVLPVADPSNPTSGREYHAMLAVRVGDETWMLDSRASEIYLVGAPPYDYRWDKEQVPGSTGFRDVSQVGPV